MRSNRLYFMRSLERDWNPHLTHESGGVFHSSSGLDSPEHFVGVAWDGSLLVGRPVALRLEQRVRPAVHHHGGRGHGDDGHAVAHAGLQAVVPLVVRDRQQTCEREGAVGRRADRTTGCYFWRIVCIDSVFLFSGHSRYCGSAIANSSSNPSGVAWPRRCTATGGGTCRVTDYELFETRTNVQCHND